MGYINLTKENLSDEHLCCAISTKMHQEGVELKKEWLEKRIEEGHIFRKLQENGKVFIEYAPLDKSFVPVIGDNYMYIYCLWVSGKYKGNGHAKALLEYCIDDAKRKNKSGVCILSSKKKKPFLSEKKFLEKYNFEVIDEIDDYQLLGVAFDNNETPKFSDTTKENKIKSDDLTIYYSNQCPYINNCIKEIDEYCKEINIKLNLILVDNLESAKTLPSIFNNWAVFYKGEFKTIHLLNKGYLKKMLEGEK